MRVITDSWVMAAMMRSAPRRQNGRSQGLARLRRRSASARFPPPTQWRKTGGHIQIKHATQQSGPVPIRCSRLFFFAINTMLARCGNKRVTKLAMRRQAAGIAHEMDTGQGY
jgi:hypothetical protein